MVAVDTNVLVRFLTGDNAEQFYSASNFLREQPVWISKTVLLELSWVLTSAYGYDAQATRAAILSLLGLHNIQVENSDTIKEALLLTEAGLDFADALHLAATPTAMTFTTFDKSLVKRAKRAGVAGIDLLA